MNIKFKKLILKAVIISALTTSISTQIFAEKSDISNKPILYSSNGYTNKKISFTNSRLENAIKAKLKVKEVTEENIKLLTELNVRNFKLTDLDELKYAPNLTTISLNHKAINNLTYLQKFKNINKLDFSKNNISDITPLQSLQSLPHITKLDLSNNQIEDISILSNFTNLTALNLRTNNIRDITPLQNLTNLTELDLSDTLISNDISILSNFTNLNILKLSTRRIIDKISDISPLQNLTDLTYLELSGHDISDITPLQNLTKLSYLYLNTNNISDITPLQNLTKLIELQLIFTNASDITPLKNLTDLTYLYLIGNKISDITPLRNLTNLFRLELAKNDISNLTPLEGLPNLDRLDLSDNDISDLTPLQNLTSLNTLAIDYNKISDISPLRNLTNLRRVDLNNNNIYNIEPILNLKAAKVLREQEINITVYSKKFTLPIKPYENTEFVVRPYSEEEDENEEDEEKYTISDNVVTLNDNFNKDKISIDFYKGDVFLNFFFYGVINIDIKDENDKDNPNNKPEKNDNHKDENNISSIDLDSDDDFFLFKPAKKSSNSSKILKSLKYIFTIDSKEYKKVTESDTTVYTMDVSPIIQNDRTMLPLRYVGDVIGADVNYDSSSRTATFTKNNLTASIQIDGNIIKMSDGKTYEMDSNPLIVNDRILISLTNISKVFNLSNGNTKDGINQDIEWNEDDKTVTIYVIR